MDKFKSYNKETHKIKEIWDNTLKLNAKDEELQKKIDSNTHSIEVLTKRFGEGKGNFATVELVDSFLQTFYWTYHPPTYYPYPPYAIEHPEYWTTDSSTYTYGPIDCDKYLYSVTYEFISGTSNGYWHIGHTSWSVDNPDRDGFHFTTIYYQNYIYILDLHSFIYTSPTPLVGKVRIWKIG